MPKRKKKGATPATPRPRQTKSFTVAVAGLLALLMVVSVLAPALSSMPIDNHDHDDEVHAPSFEDGHWSVYNEAHGHYESYEGDIDYPPIQEEDGSWLVWDIETEAYWYIDDLENKDNHTHDTAAEFNDSAAFASTVGYTGIHDYVDKGVSVYTVSDSLPFEQLVDVDTAYRFFIYLMDKEGYVPNAIIGAMTYMMCEGGSYSEIMQGTFTYQSDWIYPGPGGRVMDKTMDNLAWIRWLNNDGYETAKYESGNCNIGLGLTQESDVWWYSKDNKTTSNATKLITAAIAAGTYWQNPAFQVEYIINNKFSLDWAWDLNDVPGVNPKTSTGVSALEWATRVWCGVGMPSYVSTTAPEIHPDGFASHTANLRRATILYEKYSGIDPWFYKLAADWHNPFDGPEVQGTTSHGLLLARMALLLASDEKVVRISDHSYTAPELVGEPTLQYYRQGCHSVGKNVLGDGEYFASCDVALSTAVLLSGLDSSFPRFYVGDMRAYMLQSDRWEFCGTSDTVALQPGDVLIEPSPSDPHGDLPNTGRHAMIWVGDQVANERFPGTAMNIYEASFYSARSDNAYYPVLREASTSAIQTNKYYVFRCVRPEYSSTYWDKFILEYGAGFSELTKVYAVSGGGVLN